MRKLLTTSLIALPFTAAAEAPNVVTDIAPVHSLVAQVMQGVGTPDLLVEGGASPHDFQFRFDEAAAVQNADLVIWVGASLTPWLDDAIDTLGPDVSRIALLNTEGWPKLTLRTDDAFADGHDHGHDDHADEAHDDHGHDDHADEAHDDHGHEDHSDETHDDHGHEDHSDETHDDHGHDDHADETHDDHDTARVDPHAWLDPQVAQAWVTIIADQLSTIDPDNAATYDANATAAIADLAALETEIAQKLADAPAGDIVVPHDAYQYFGARFDRLAVATIALDDASAPTPDRIADLQARITADDISCVLADPQARSEWTDLIREGSNAGSALADPVGGTFEAGPDHYRATLTALGDAYVTCLGG